MTRPVIHIARLLKWGRILARHGALRGIETAPATPPGVKRLCRVLEVSRSGFYRWLKAAPARAARAAADAALAEEITQIHGEFDGTYGSPRVTAELRADGHKINHKRVERVMRAFGIVGLHLRKKVRTTLPEPADRKAPDLIKRDFAAPAANQCYVGDITYLPVGDGGFLYSVNELATAVKYRVPVVVLVLNDDRYGAIKWLQERIFGRWGEADLVNPDFVALARAFGCRARRVESPEALPGALRDAFAGDGPTVVELPLTVDPPWEM